MTVHHLACGTMCPPLARLAIGGPRLICHCLLVESAAGLILVDTGFGTGDVDHPGRLGRTFVAVSRPRFDRAATALAQVGALGYDPRDVRHIVVTHLDLDHAGGIGDFPWATLHVHGRELDAATRPTTFGERHRYRPVQFAQHDRVHRYDDDGDDFLGLAAVRPLDGLADDVALVPLCGHSRGHSGVAVRTGDRYLLHAGDAYFHRGELADTPRCPPGLDLFQRLVQVDGTARRANQAQLRRLARDHRDQVTVFSAHDPVEFDSLAAATKAGGPLASAGDSR